MFADICVLTWGRSSTPVPLAISCMRAMLSSRMRRSINSAGVSILEKRAAATTGSRCVDRCDNVDLNREMLREPRTRDGSSRRSVRVEELGEDAVHRREVVEVPEKDSRLNHRGQVGADPIK